MLYYLARSLMSLTIISGPQLVTKGMCDYNVYSYFGKSYGLGILVGFIHADAEGYLPWLNLLILCCPVSQFGLSCSGGTHRSYHSVNLEVQIGPHDWKLIWTTYVVCVFLGWGFSRQITMNLDTSSYRIFNWKCVNNELNNQHLFIILKSYSDQLVFAIQATHREDPEAKSNVYNCVLRRKEDRWHNFIYGEIITGKNNQL